MVDRRTLLSQGARGGAALVAAAISVPRGVGAATNHPISAEPIIAEAHETPGTRFLAQVDLELKQLEWIDGRAIRILPNQWGWLDFESGTVTHVAEFGAEEWVALASELTSD